MADVHITESPTTITYTSVNSRETICNALTIAALDDLEVKVLDVLNACVGAPVKENI